LDYEAAYSQKINLSKSNVIFDKEAHPIEKDKVLLILGIREVLSYDKYLGLPSRIGKVKMIALFPIKGQICNRSKG